METRILIQLLLLYSVTSLADAVSQNLYDGSETVLGLDEKELNTNRLLLRDCPVYPFIGNAVDHIRALVVGKLNLPHLEWQILQAAYTDKGLLFEMVSPIDVGEILEKFELQYRNRECVLKTTFKDFFPMEIHNK